MPAWYFLAVIPRREGRNHAPAGVSRVERWRACAQVLGDDAEELQCSVQKVYCTCLLWRGCQAQVPQHISVAMFWYPMPLAR